MEKTIYELSFLQNYILGLNPEDEKIIEHNKHYIYEAKVINKNGKKREVYILNGKDGYRLSLLQERITKNYLIKLSLPSPVKGFVKGESYRTFLSEHIGNNFFLRLDIKSFFKNIDIKKFNKEFINIIKINDNKEKEKSLKLIENLCFYNGSLPQGACSSPAISNVIFSRTDQRILKYCQRLNVRYTRYADDLLFSSEQLSFKDNKWFTKKIKHILYDMGYELNYKKMIYSINGELNLNGYILNNIEVRISRRRFREIYSIINTVNNTLNVSKCNLANIILDNPYFSYNFIYWELHEIKNKVKGIKFYYLKEKGTEKFSEIIYNYILIDEAILWMINLQITNNSMFNNKILEFNKNKGNWKYPKYRFKSMNAISEYLLGQRSYLISWISKENTYNQKRIKKVICLIENTIDKIDTIYN